MKNLYFPSNSMLEEAVLEALALLDGTATIGNINAKVIEILSLSDGNINAKVIEILSLSDEIVQLEDESGLGTKLDYRLRWARTNLKSKGKIKNVTRGTWTLV